MPLQFLTHFFWGLETGMGNIEFLIIGTLKNYFVILLKHELKIFIFLWTKKADVAQLAERKLPKL